MDFWKTVCICKPLTESATPISAATITRMNRIERRMLRVISSHSPPVSTAHTLETGIYVSPVAISMTSNSRAIMPSAINKSAVCLRGCFISDACNNKVNRIQAPDEKYESSRVTQRRDGQLPIPNNRFRLSASTVSCCYKQSFRSRLLRLRI